MNRAFRQNRCSAPHLCSCLKKCSSSCWRGVDSFSNLGKDTKNTNYNQHIHNWICSLGGVLLSYKIWCCTGWLTLLPCCVLQARTGLSPGCSISTFTLGWNSSISGSTSNSLSLSFFFFFSSGCWGKVMYKGDASAKLKVILYYILG